MANFALGLRAGADAGNSFVHSIAQAQRAMREQEEYEKQKAYEEEIKQAASPAAVGAQQGLRFTDANGASFYVPESVRDAYVRAVGESGQPLYTQSSDTPVNYQEVSAGGRSTQFAGLEAPASVGLARSYNDSRFSRMRDVAMAHGKWADASAMEGLQNAPLQRRHLELSNQAAENQLQEHPFRMEQLTRQQRYAQLEDKFHEAVLGGVSGLVSFYAGEMPDGYSAKAVPKKGGGFELVQIDDATGKQIQSLGQFKDEKELQLMAMKKAPALLSKALELQEKADEKKLWAETTLKAAGMRQAGYTPNFSLAGQLPNGSPVAFDTRTGQLTDASTGKALSSEQVKLFNKVTGDKPGKDPNMVKVKVGGANGEAEIQMPYMQAVNEGFVPPPKAYLAAKANAQKVGAVAEMDAAGNIAYSKDGGAWYSSLADIPSSNKRGLSQAPVAPSEYEVARKARRDEVFDGAIRGLAGVLGGVPNR